MRFIGLVMLLAGLWANPAMAAEQASDTKAAQTKSADEAAKSPEQQAMDALAEAGIRQALQAIQRSGGMYPFGLIRSGETVQAVGYSGEKEDAPPADEWARALFGKLRAIGNERGNAVGRRGRVTEIAPRRAASGYLSRPDQIKGLGQTWKQSRHIRVVEDIKSRCRRADPHRGLAHLNRRQLRDLF